MLRVTPVRSGVDYLLTGCVEHGQEVGVDAALRREPASPEQYYLKGQEHGPAGVWRGEGVGELGLTAGAAVTERDVRAVLGDLCDPRIHGEIMAGAEERIAAEGLSGGAARRARAEARADAIGQARLGSAPRQYKTAEARAQARIEGRGAPVGPEERAVILAEERRKPSGNVIYRDFTFSPSKSVSIYHAGLLSAGRTEDARKVEDAHHAGVKAAQAYLEKHGGYSRAGYHGRGRDGKGVSVGRFVDGHEWIGAEFTHLVNREGEPQLHSHLAVANRVLTVDADGTAHWRALDSNAIRPVTAAAGAIYERTYEAQIERDLPVVFETRPDGKAREIAGIDKEARDAFSTRRAQVVEARDKYAEAYREKYGREPSAYALTLMSEMAALETRKPKESALPADQMLARWEERAQERLGASLSEVVERAEARGVEVRIEALRGDVAPIDRVAVIEGALSAVQERRATWTRADLIREINRALPDQWKAGDLGLELGTAAGSDDPVAGVTPVLDSLADEALSGRYGTVQVAGHELISPPQELRRVSDGRSVYRPGHDEVYVTARHLSEEERVIAQASAPGAPALNPVAIEAAIEKASEGRKPLTDDQAAAVRGVLGDGRAASVIVGPAGAGKTTTQRAITGAWTEAGMGRVIALAPSSVAAHVLGAEIGGRGVNTPLWLKTVTSDHASTLRDEWSPRRGDLIVMDEAGMAATSQMRDVMALAEAAGAKVVFAGDHAQFGSPEAGGLFKELTNGPVYELDTVRRFREADGSVRQWEAEASLRLRLGDVTAVEAYERNGRLHGGTREDMQAEIVDRYVADTLDGRDSAISASTNEIAAEISTDVRERFVQLRLVEREGAALADTTRAGVGDLIQTRDNDYGLIDSEGMPVYNRFIYRVEDYDRGDGSLTVRRITGRDEDGAVTFGGRVTLPADYVQESVQLGYAGTGHAVQGRTLSGDSYGLFDESTTREGVYVPMTRSERENHAFWVTERPATEHEQEPLNSDPVSMMARALENDSTELSAVETLRRELDFAESFSTFSPMFTDVTGGWHRQRADAMLAGMLPLETYERLRAEGPDSVYRQLRAAELDGHDVEQLLRETTGRQMQDAESVPGLLYWRIEQALQEREPEHEPASGSWRSRVPEQMHGPLGDFARDVADAMDARQTVLGERVAADPPQWATDRLGPVPVDVLEREDWSRRAGAVESYREAYGVDVPGVAIGPMPPRGAVEQSAAWDEAYRSLGHSEQERHIIGADDEALRRMALAYEREQTWAPAFVREEQRDAIHGRDHYDVHSRLAEARAERSMDPAELERERTRAEAYRELSGALDERAGAYGEINEARDAWYRETAALRESAEAARAELGKRGIDFDQERRDGRRTIREWFADQAETVRDRFRGQDQTAETPQWEQAPLFEIEHDPWHQTTEQQPEAAAFVDQASEPAAEVEAAQPEASAGWEQPALFALTEDQLAEQAELTREREAELAAAEPEAQAEVSAPEIGAPQADAEVQTGIEVSPLIADLAPELQRARDAVAEIGERAEAAEAEEEQTSPGIDAGQDAQQEADAGIEVEDEHHSLGPAAAHTIEAPTRELGRGR